MGSSGSCNSSGSYLVKGDLIDMSWDYIHDRFHLRGDVYVYANSASSLVFAKHHGIIVSIPEETHYWAIERLRSGLEKTRGKNTNGCKDSYIGNYSVAKIYEAANAACSGRDYNVSTNNCNHWVERFVTALGYTNVKVGTWSGIN